MTKTEIKNRIEKLNQELRELAAEADQLDAVDAQEEELRAARSKNPLKVGDILQASWGYDQTNVDFYEVVKATRCTVTLQRIMGQVVLANVGQNKVGPRKGCPVEGYALLKNKRVQDYNGRPYVKITSYAYAYLTTEDATHSETAAGYGH